MRLAWEVTDTALQLEFGGLASVALLRRRLVVPRSAVTAAGRAPRAELEPQLDHRVSGLGPHRGDRRPGRTRIGTMLGRGVVGRQLWVVPAGPPDAVLAVIDLTGQRWVRLVLGGPGSTALVDALTATAT